MNDKAKQLARYYREHLPAFAHDLLKIRLEAGGIAPLSFNLTQQRLHHLLEQQKSHLGRVRAIVLKPRREGLSTYIAARYFHQTIFGDALKTLITSHNIESTKVLFDMAKLYWERLLPEFQPQAEHNSANKLSFSHSLGSYAVATAGNPEASRGSLSHLFHGSEVAYWREAEDVLTAALETVGDCPGTEVVLESTGFPGSYFEELWDKAVAGKSPFQAIFFAWFESPRNRAEAQELIPNAEEKELMRIFPTLSLENLAFRRAKLATMSETKFNREYPATPAHAFMADSKSAFIGPEIVEVAAQRNHYPSRYAPRVLGVDPSQSNDGDDCGLCIRQGSSVLKLARFKRERVQERSDVIKRFYEQHECDHLFIDQGGSGKEIYELLLQWGFSRSRITLVPFAAKASNQALYPNKRVEMYHHARNWLREEGAIPNDLNFKAELSLVQSKTDNHGREVLQSKKEMRCSPNLADAFALTFAYPISRRHHG